METNIKLMVVFSKMARAFTEKLGKELMITAMKQLGTMIAKK